MVVVFLALGVAGCGSQKLAIPLFGPFAGYSWHGPVRQLSAVVVVPEINACSARGAGGTWIGAEGQINPTTQVAPFFQVGVNEECSNTLQYNYYAFWSSTGKQFHPQWLLPVSAGDRVQLSMRRVGDHWLMSARDQSSGQRQSVTVTLVRQTRFGDASWHQEDVTDGETMNPFPYPSLGAVRFSSLRVDGRLPRARALTTIWMSAQDATFGPTPLTADAFSIGQIHPSDVDLRYQRIAIADDLAADLFNARLASWTGSTPSATVRAGALSFARALRRNIASFRGDRWPRQVRGPIDLLVARTTVLRRLVVQLAARTSFLVEFRRSLYRDAIGGNSIGDAGMLVKERLHMGITDLSLGSIQSYIRTHSG